MANDLLIYGANGYTGALVAREAALRGLRPILAGRNGAQVAALAGKLGLECRVFGLERARDIDGGLAATQAVLNCAGPFVRTAWPLIDSCLRLGVHYLDITGEIPQFERLAAMDTDARSAGVMLLPGAGFDVVPSDCLAAHLKERLPSARRLMLGICSTGGYSRGTATTAIENAHQGAIIRRNGSIQRIPAGSLNRTIDFGRGPVPAVIMPWGDVATAYYSTGIPDIEVYFAFPGVLRSALVASRYLQPILRRRAVQSVVTQFIRAGKPGPTAQQRERGYALLWGEVTDDHGQAAVARLRTPEAYHLTVLSCVSILQKVSTGQIRPGFQTPSLAYGAGLVMELPGVALSDAVDPVVL